ncbi:MAG: hypothetical protein ACTSYB_12280, partial [Candidatus Helarchaeota archaeon]
MIKQRPCPFLSTENFCLINENKFIACRKYPIQSWIDLGKVFAKLGLTHEYYEIDLNCTSIKTQPALNEAIKT